MMAHFIKGTVILLLIAWIPTFIKAQASQQINVRIASGSGDGKSYGRVEVSKGGSAWGTVCDTGWDDNEARVVCKQLGYLWGRGYANSKYGQGTGVIYIDNVICKGNEASLSDCISSQWGTHQCSHSKEASVQCFNTTVFVPSAVDGVYGPVLVWHQDQWMPVCDSSWSDKQAQVVCKQLDFTTGYGFCCSTFTTWTQSIGTYSKALTVGTCNSGATKIEDCRSVVLSNACGYRHQASVLCLNQTKDSNAFKVRLSVNGRPSNTTTSGRVEVRYKGKWGTICTKNATDEIAEVACVQMGYAGGWALGARPGISNLMVWMGNVSCDGTEASLLKCESSGLGKFGFCDHDSDVHVLCYEDAYSKAECRMTVLGTEYAGKQNKTASSLTCQRWDSQYPHAHGSNKTMQFPENDLADAANYCRNPGAWRGGLWCYTTSRTVIWDKCDVPLCKSDQCKHTMKGTHYNGTMSAVGNIPCQRWDSQTPHPNSMSQRTTFIDGNATLAQNYCRNPDNDPRGPWCYSTVTTPIYQYCNIPYCSFHDKCRRTPLGREYTGTKSISKNGYPCLSWYGILRSLRWGTQFPEHSTSAAKNYCRNPKNKPKGPWCYVSLNNRIYYDYCNIPFCNEIKVRLMGGKERSHGGRVEIEYDGQWGTICDRNWNNKAARVVCRRLGYADGVANRTTYTDKASGPVWLDRLNCTGNETSIEKCNSKGRWNVKDTACTGHSRDAGVLCSIDVKLGYGYMKPNQAIGMILLYNNSIWSKQCGNTWDDNASKVVCRQLGYNYSKTLCCSTYGMQLRSVAFYHPQCFGNETKIHECKFIPRTCQSHSTNYASVMCSKTPFRALEIGLAGAKAKSANFSGNVVAMYSGVTGSICRNGWGDEEATVVCRGLNYKAGVALQHRLDKTVDILASDFRCKGTEQHILDCTYRNTSSCPTPFRYSKQAGVLCYNKTGLAFRIVEQSPGAGRVEVQYDGVWGTVCDSLWSNYDAGVFCRQNGYRDGIAVRGSRMGRGTGPVYLTGFSCRGTESTILQCINFGWKSVYSSCLNHSRDAGVKCFQNVRLYRSVANSTTKAAIGAVLVRKSGLWGRVCSSGFDDNDALVACRELHYTHGKYLGPGVFGNIYISRIWMSDTQCQGNEDSILNCTYNSSSLYSCRYDYSDYASVMCYSGTAQPKFDLATRKVFVRDAPYFRRVLFEVLGMRTRVCSTAWTDVTSNVTCKQLGYTGGVAMITRSNTSLPVLTPKFNCNSQHTKIEQCRTDYRSNVRCPNTSFQAGVLCYNKSPGVQFRISGGRSRSIGRAEIGYEGKWGTICPGSYAYHTNLSRLAKVHCRSMGYPNGKVSYSSVTAASSGTPINLRMIRCTGNEANLLMCMHYGWMGRNTSCNHRSDLKVSCDTDVRIGSDNSKSFGPLYVRYSTGRYSSYYLICDNTFTDREANVACRNLGYPGGRALCCSAFGRVSGLIRVKDVRCLEEGRDISKCAHTIIGSNYQCPNRAYASVACFDKPPSTAMSISLTNATSPIKGTVSAPVTVTYLGIPGNICPSTWTDKEAMVVCRQLGYAGGQVYRHYPPPPGPFWLGNISCTGYENSLLDCKVSGRGGVRCTEKRYVWGTYLTAGGVVCWPTKTAPPKYNLVNGTKRSGRVEINFNGTKGAICQYSFYSNEAAAVCRGMGFLGGVHDRQYFGYNYTGRPFIQRLKCGANASSVADCSHSSWRNSMQQQMGRACQAVGVTCFGKVRLVVGPTNNFGIVQLDKGSIWYNMCDEGFDDMAAQVVCKELGFTDGKKVCCSTFRRMAYTGNQVLNNIKCQGSETSLEKCESDTAHCTSGRYASVYCVNNTVDVTKPTKFYLSRDYNLRYTGSVNVMYKGVLGRVCSQGWTDREANLFCKQLNYKGGVAFTQNLINPMPVMISNVTCSGASKTLERCTFDDVITSENGGCDRFSPTAGVLCAQSDTSIGYRLVDGGDSYGRAEIKYDGVWGTICSDAWSTNDATVFCRSLGKGFVYGKRKYQSFGKAVGSPVWFTNTYCNGNDSSPLQCQSSGWLQVRSYCRTHSYDAAVQCYGKVRLDTASYGRIMVYTENTWSSVCEQDWGQKETDVVCKSLGYSVGYTLCCAAFGANYRLARITGFQCTGTESDLLDCPHRKAKDAEGRACTRQNYASVACSNRTLTAYEDLKLSGNSNTGKVLIAFNNIYGRICQDGWDNNAARVVCRELGFRDGTTYTHYESSYYGSYNPYWTSNVKCNGFERTLQQCPKTAYGKVTSCSSRHSAGVLCFRNSGVTVRMTGSDDPKTGTVEVMVDGTWGTVCNSYFGDPDAKVLCTSMNFADGIAISRTPYGRSGEAKTVWYNRLNCFGNESSIDVCPHSSWKKATSFSCRYHRHDVAVNCYGHVRLINTLSGPKPINNTSGAVQVFTSNSSSSSASKTWFPVCDEGFTDSSARRVCQELGFIDGHAICCSAYGKQFGNITDNSSVSLQDCENSVMSLKDCVKLVPFCKNGTYASVMCLTDRTIQEDGTHKFTLEDTSKGDGRILVKVFSTTGRVCSVGWDDTDAMVYCKSKGYPSGIAYFHSKVGSKFQTRQILPYLVSDVDCKGDERSLDNCTFSKATSLNRNCTEGHDAGVICFKEGGISYRRVAPPNKIPANAGRVEIKVGTEWGTVCDSMWDKYDAAVFCRSLGESFNDGDATYRSNFGRGAGPIWLSHLQCKGTEASLHQCAHRGFDASFDAGNGFRYWDYCKGHFTDAGVVCYKNVRLNQIYQKVRRHVHYGTVEVYDAKKKAWGGVCFDDGFNDNAAKVVCSELGYVDGRAVPRTSFGNVTGGILVNKVLCSGNEKSLVECKKSSPSCKSGQYAGVYCSNETITDTGFKVAFADDKYKSEVHGSLEVTLNGITGRVCGYNWGKHESTVACKGLGFMGGIPLLHIALNMQPTVMSNVSCAIGATTLASCSYKKWGDNYACRANSFEAGVLCYKKNFEIRLANGGTGPNPSFGRIDIKYDDVWGTVCDWNWKNADARVMCREKGFADGIAKGGSHFGAGRGRIWVERFFCRGTEKSLMECLNTGFNRTVPNYYYCASHRRDASVICYNEKIEVDKVRLAEGNRTAGRLEVYATGIGRWGTVCNDLFNNNAANVVCRMLGFAGGKPSTAYPAGSGEILLDNVLCKGDEKSLKECRTNDIGSHNCKHEEDIGVICEETSPSTTTTTTKPVKSTVTPKGTLTEQPPTKAVSPGKQTGPGLKKSGILAAIIVPIVIIILFLAAIAGFIIYRIRSGKAAAAAAAATESNGPSGRECPMQISNVLYDMAMEDRPHSQEIPTNFENPMYDNANSNKADIAINDDGASGVYASLDTPPISVKSKDGEASPRHNKKKKGKSDDKDGLVDNIHLDVPNSDEGSNV
ncbi:deleted in malignant brain tumors 1 protein-like [Lineus longissimus]|uniref:deleted in malignant brain tumors 1 protein-like n=1 Tax=Lineus longissimus TaxID=88925 RepID=UPI002B4C824A